MTTVTRLTPSPAVRIFVATGATDRRRSIDGLAVLGRERFALDTALCADRRGNPGAQQRNGGAPALHLWAKNKNEFDICVAAAEHQLGPARRFRLPRSRAEAGAAADADWLSRAVVEFSFPAER